MSMVKKLFQSRLNRTQTVWPSAHWKKDLWTKALDKLVLLAILHALKTRIQLYLPSPLPPRPTYNVKSFYLGRGDSKAFFKVFSFVNSVAMCLWSTHWELSKNSRFNFRKISSGEWNSTSRNFRKRDSLGRPKFITLESSSRNVRNF